MNVKSAKKTKNPQKPKLDAGFVYVLGLPKTMFWW